MALIYHNHTDDDDEEENDGALSLDFNIVFVLFLFHLFINNRYQWFLLLFVVSCTRRGAKNGGWADAPRRNTTKQVTGKPQWLLLNVTQGAVTLCIF